MMTEVKGVDPRVKRTHQLLQQALQELSQEKCFASITVQDIAERATLNRATFYAHFEDKYELLDSIVREKFQQEVASKLPPGSRWGVNTLRVLIEAVFDFLREVQSRRQPTDTQFEPLVERAVQQELSEFRVIIRAVFDYLREMQSQRRPTDMQLDSLFERTAQEELREYLLSWLKQVPASGMRRVPLETMASMMSWAILGTAVQWSHGARTTTTEQMVTYVLSVITEGVAHLVPGLGLE